MQGKRVYGDAEGLYLKLGEYGIDPRTGTWYACTPGGDMGNLAAHQVTEHEDGTITASPSILVTTGGPDGLERTLWHGYLERGVWREV
jgi:hypothetical protein